MTSRLTNEIIGMRIPHYRTITGEHEINQTENAEIFATWLAVSSVLVTCLVFVREPSFVAFFQFKSPPDEEYSVVIYFLGLSGGLVCFLWEVDPLISLPIHWISMID